MVGHISKLSQEVIDRISAGEIIHRPVDIVKELVENSIDAGSTSIAITLTDGGVRMIKIQDNGCGIHEDDLPLLCERHTTSKLSSFEQLIGVNSFGFRGEALASISVVSHVGVVTRMRTHSDYAYAAKYEKNQLVAPPRICAGNYGTTISIEQLFYEDPIRLKSLKNYNEEYRKVLDLIAKYALHYHQIVGFTLRKPSCPIPDIKTIVNNAVEDDVANQVGKNENNCHDSVATQRDIVKGLFGIDTTIHPVTLECEANLFTCSLLISHPSFSCKKTKSIIFINNRLVDCKLLRDAIENLYKNIAPKIVKPFFYVNLKLSSNTIDVNCHPNKKDVIFLNQNEITGAIVQRVADELKALSQHHHLKEDHLNLSNLECQTSRPAKWFPAESHTSDRRNPTTDTSILSYVTSAPIDRSFTNARSIIKHSSPTPTISDENKNNVSDGNLPKPLNFLGGLTTGEENPPKNSSSFAAGHYDKPIHDKFTVRTCPSKQRLQTFFPKSNTPSSSRTNPCKDPNDSVTSSYKNNESLIYLDNSFESGNSKLESKDHDDEWADNTAELNRKLRLKFKYSRDDIVLSSLFELREEITDSMCPFMQNLLKECTLVGPIDFDQVLLQHHVNLYRVVFSSMLHHCFYQIIINHFGCFDYVCLEQPIALKSLLENADEYQAITAHSTQNVILTNSSQCFSGNVNTVDNLLKYVCMLNDYFSIDIDESGRLCKMPCIVSGVEIDPNILPFFVVYLVRYINFKEEKQCIQNISNLLAWFFSKCIRSKYYGKTGDPAWNEFLEISLFPFVKEHLQPTKQMSTGTPNFLTILTKLPDLYKVFERC